ncbi:Pyridoxal phosphate-dependent transferase major region subdomain 2 [Penicillium lagena]|uniref:Pyridoxal phosphate-dependent transferase major region subdomain 2 n=1 Tax=Penicillium lagena TaxID=94218 RepID=UPI00254156CC|nr:Pyridoxal phosphate-dependent transferase major region subdomain 2 [Penicillium lagena]KAJ5624258.1 Pyridoxal phosphate-dependent transferase major region subdomain 2 [Penicillium lagena]
MFGKAGEYILTEEYTFAAFLETAIPLGYRFCGIKMDQHGILQEDLDHVLSNWDEAARGAKKPTLLYTIPTGQNPSGATAPIQRRREIYEVARCHNLYILEDDPYYYIQLPPYVDGEDIEPVPDPKTVEEFRDSLIPTYLSLDTDGRVFRMDSFSKIIAPGVRMGWVVASDQVVERMTRAHEVSVQNPSGFSQIAVFKLLHDSWGQLGLAKWLTYLRHEYTKRRNVMYGACAKYLPDDLVGWEPPRAGFFGWVSINWREHPDATHLSPKEIEKQIWDAAIDNKTLITPGSWFLPDQGRHGMNKVFFRMTFAACSPETMTEGIRNLGVAIRKVFGKE